MGLLLVCVTYDKDERDVKQTKVGCEGRNDESSEGDNSCNKA